MGKLIRASTSKNFAGQFVLAIPQVNKLAILDMKLEFVTGMDPFQAFCG